MRSIRCPASNQSHHKAKRQSTQLCRIHVQDEQNTHPTTTGHCQLQVGIWYVARPGKRILLYSLCCSSSSATWRYPKGSKHIPASVSLFAATHAGVASSRQTSFRAVSVCKVCWGCAHVYNIHVDVSITKCCLNVAVPRCPSCCIHIKEPQHWHRHQGTTLISRSK
jgi:hypothetical protein